MSHKILIYGSRILARLARDILETDANLEFAGYINDWEGGEDIVGGLAEVLARPDLTGLPICPAIGYTDLAARWKAIEAFCEAGFPLYTLRHPCAFVKPSAEVSPGAILMPQTAVDRSARLGRGVVMWPGAVVNHECQVGDNVFLSSQCVLAGRSQVGSHSFLGVGATILDGVKVGSSCFVGAGVLVFDDLPDHSHVIARPNAVRMGPK